MKVSERAVDMKSERNYSNYNKIETTAMRMSTGKDSLESSEEEAAKMSISEESQSLFNQLKEKKQYDPEQLSKETQEVEEAVLEVKAEDEQIVQTIRSLFGMAKPIRDTDRAMNMSKVRQMKVQEIMEQDKSFSASVMRSEQFFGLSQQLNVADFRSSYEMEMSNNEFVKTGNVVSDYTAWVRRTLDDAHTSDYQNVTFAATGIAKLANGKEVTFGMELEMPQEVEDSFIGEESADVIITDALQICLDSRRTMISDIKMSLEFEANEKDNILKKSNKDDEERIDKSDWVFKNLKVWTTDKEGKGKLVELKGADVGAICLRSANKQFRLNNTNNMTNAMIQKKETFQKNRMAGMVQHMNLAV